MLLAGRPTRLSDLVRERAAFGEARARAAEIRARSVALHAQRGLHTQFLAAGLATWDHPGAARAPQAPVLLRACTLRPTDVQASDYDVVARRRGRGQPRAHAVPAQRRPPRHRHRLPRGDVPHRAGAHAAGSTPTPCMPPWPPLRGAARLHGHPEGARRHLPARQAGHGQRPRRPGAARAHRPARRAYRARRPGGGRRRPTEPEAPADPADRRGRRGPPTSTRTPTPRGSGWSSTPTRPRGASSRRCCAGATSSCTRPPAPARPRPWPTSSPPSRARAAPSCCCRSTAREIEDVRDAPGRRGAGRAACSTPPTPLVDHRETLRRAVALLDAGRRVRRRTTGAGAPTATPAGPRSTTGCAPSATPCATTSPRCTRCGCRGASPCTRPSAPSPSWAPAPRRRRRGCASAGRRSPGCPGSGSTRCRPR